MSVVPTFLLSEVVNRELDRRAAANGFSPNGTEMASPPDKLALRLAAISQTNENSAARTITRIRHNESTVTNSKTADVVLMALDNDDRVTDLPHLFNVRAEASDAVAFHELRGKEISAEESRRLATLLFHFSRAARTELEDAA